uniref:Uncharacterized protein n=1 Tax=Glossina pallidipes TaxID=7398 RepID=A0A1A9ZH03_GLOPL
MIFNIKKDRLRHNERERAGRHLKLHNLPPTAAQQTSATLRLRFSHKQSLKILRVILRGPLEQEGKDVAVYEFKYSCDEEAEDTTTAHGKHDEAKSGANILLAVIMQAIQAEQQQMQARYEQMRQEKALKTDETTKNRTTTPRNGIEN